MKSIKKIFCLVYLLLNTVVLRAQDNHWDVNIYDYQYDMTIYAELVSDGVLVTDYSDYEIAAFINNECRGVGVPNYQNGVYWLHLRVWSNSISNDPIAFKVYRKSDGKESYLSTTIPISFSANENVGYPSSPVQLQKTAVYSISVSSSDDTMGSASIVNYKNEAPANSKVIIEATPRKGYAFLHWTHGADVYTENPYSFIITEDVSYVAHFKIGQYTITFDTDGGSEVAAISQDYNTAVTAPAEPTKVGYTFAGWEGLPSTIPAENITVKALWAINKYKLTYNVDGAVYKEYDVEYNAAITPEIAPSKEGHTFSGWSEIPTRMPAHDVEVNGTFSVNSYQLTYLVDGEVYYSESVPFGTPIVLIAEPTKAGETFSGWKGAPATMPAHDVVITGSFDTNTYTLTYKVDGEVYKSVQYAYGTAITPEADPEKEGYTFSGWSEIPATMPDHDVEVNGTFIINQYMVTFIADGVVILEASLDFGSAITPPATPSKEGHTFIGWEPAVDATVPAHDVIYTAVFSVNQYTISFDSDGGSEVAPVTLDYNSAVTAPAEPIKVGYTFVGWEGLPSTMPAENITVKALWAINKYKLTYNVDDAVYKEYEVEYNAAITPEVAPSKEGHTFSGWSEIPTRMPAHDVEVNGSFSVNSYQLTYLVDGEVYYSESVPFGTPIVLIAEPTKAGETFSGWKGAPATMPAHDLVITGSFDSNTYTLTYNVDGEVYKSVQYVYGTAIIPEDDPEKEGYTFSGWSEIPATMPDHDVEVNGTFIINQYMVTFIADGIVIQEASLDFGSAITPPATPSKEGHTFIGWEPAADATVPAHNVIYTAVFSVNQYTISFDSDGGSEVAPITLDYNTTVTAPTEPTKVGYTFAGWEDLPSTMPAENITVKALWTINKYKLTYNVDGAVYKEYEVEYNAAITPEVAPSKEGYTFSGWSEIPATMPDHDVEVNGTFVINQYMVTFIADGIVIQEASLDFGSAITPPTAPSKEGHTFIGWEPAVDATVPAHDVTYVGLFAVNSYKLTYIVDEEVYRVYDVEYASEIIPEEEPTREGYVFSGWSEIPLVMPAHDVEVFGYFEAEEIDVQHIIIEDNTEGELAQRIDEACKYDILSLTISGKLNGTDIKCLRDILQNGKLEHLDISKASIVRGGELYDGIYSTEDNVIGDNMFKNSASLKQIGLPNNTKEIKSFAFDSCPNLASLTIPQKCESLDEYALQRCSVLENIYVQEGNLHFKSIDGILFSSNGETLVKVPYAKDVRLCRVPDSVTAIGGLAFEDTNVADVTLPASLQEIGRYAFHRCESLDNVIIPDAVSKIGEGAFQFCSSLTVVKLPTSMMELEDFTFSHCSKLKNITLPKGIKSVSAYAFSSSESLQSIDVDDSNDYFCSSGNVLYSKDMNILVIHPAGLVNEEYIVPDGVEVISTRAFADCQYVLSVHLPTSVREIGDYAFYKSGIESILLPESIKKIGENAFSMCASLLTLVFPRYLERIESGVLSHSTKLAHISIPQSVNYIGQGALKGCRALEDIECWIENVSDVEVSSSDYIGPFEGIKGDCTWHVLRGHSDDYNTQSLSWWIETWKIIDDLDESIVGIETTQQVNSLSIIPSDHSVIVNSPTDSIINIYNLRGQIITMVNVKANSNTVIPLASGLYVIEGRKMFVR